MMFHKRCESIEVLLRARCGDLEAEVDRLREELKDQHQKAVDRERELMDRLMAVTNPAALMASRSTAPTPPLPQLPRQLPRQLPGSNPRYPRTAAAPVLTPAEPVPPAPAKE